MRKNSLATGATSIACDCSRTKQKHCETCRFGHSSFAVCNQTKAGAAAAYGRLSEVSAPRKIVRLADWARTVWITIRDGPSACLAAPGDVVSRVDFTVIVVIADNRAGRYLQYACAGDKRRVIRGARVAG